ncbi:MAG: hypothetical protein ACI9FN_003883 [Saprospiraceae bacterium]|jgi:hypothetical protein
MQQYNQVRKCKVNYVHSVKQIMSKEIFASNIVYDKYLAIPYNIRTSSPKNYKQPNLDNLADIICFTHKQLESIHVETGDIKDELNPQHELVRSQRSLIFRTRIFRSIRLNTSEVRNASKSENRKHRYNDSKQSFWAFKTCILQSAIKLYKHRNIRDISKKKRSTTGSQINRANLCFCQKFITQESFNQCARDFTSSSKKILNINSSSDYQKNLCLLEKKSINTPQPSLVRNKAVEQYESIRSRSLGLYRLRSTDYVFILKNGMYQWAFQDKPLEDLIPIKMVKNNSAIDKSLTPITQILTNMIINAHKETEYDI